MKENKKIVVGLSGGVDSAVVLALLEKQGWAPVGVFLKLPNWPEVALESAQKVCEKIGAQYFIIDAQKEFKKQVVDYFLKEVRQGRTPNPCVICNRYLKFKKLFEFAEKKRIKYVATGHYADKSFNEKTNKYELLIAEDEEKDQTYYLAFLTQKQLKNIIFPLARYNKEEIFKLASEFNIKDMVQKKPSQDFCYLGGKSLSGFLEKELGENSGKIKDEQGNVLGEHQGAHFFTIGQRSGLGLSGGPYFVKKLDKKNNLVIVTKNKKGVSQKEIFLYPFNFISGKAPQKAISIKAKIRYQYPSALATLFPPNKKKRLKIIFNKPQIAVTPGQFCVFYQKNVCLGAGAIN